MHGTLHLLDCCSRTRAEQARLAFARGFHAEVYGAAEELVEHAPRSGLVIARDDEGEGGIIGLLQQLSSAGICVPVVATSLSPEPRRIVAAIRAGALDYLALPLADADFADRLAPLAEAAQEHVEARQRMIRARHKIANLSPREREVLDWLARGNSNKAIAQQLEISPRTVEIHRANMMTKLGARHPADAVRIRLESGDMRTG